MTKILEPALTPDDAPWGRQVNERLLAAETRAASLEATIETLRRAIAGASSTSARLLSEVEPRRTYRSWSAPIWDVAPGPPRQEWTPTTLDRPEQAWGSPVVITLDRRRSVYVEFGTDASVTAQVGAHGWASTQLYPRIWVNGIAIYTYIQLGGDLTTGVDGTPGAQTSKSGNVRIGTLVDLPEGEYTIQGAAAISFSPSQGAAAKAGVRGWDLKVEVGDPAEPDGTGDDSPLPEPGSTD